MSKRGPIIVAAAVAATVLFAGRLALPVVLKTALNSSLGGSAAHPGRIEDVELHLWRGVFAASGLKLLDPEHGPFLSAERIEVSVHWGSLVRGGLKAEIHLVAPRLSLVRAAPVAHPVPFSAAGIVGQAKAVFPIDIAVLTISDGSVRFRDPAATPALDVFIDRLELVATDISNRRRLAPVATLDAKGRPMGQGRLELHARFDTLANQVHLDLDGKIRDFPLLAVDDLIREHAGVMVSSGTLDLFAEVAVKDGGFKGYVKPFLKELAFAPKGTKGIKMRELVMGEVAEYVTGLLTNQRKGSAATRIEFAGSFTDPKVDPKAALEAAFKHAFIKALKPGVEHSVQIDLVKKKD